MSKALAAAIGKWVLHKFDIAAKFFFYTVALIVTISLGAAFGLLVAKGIIRILSDFGVFI